MQMRSYKLTDFGKPVQEVIQDVPEPRGTEVLVRVTRAGVCHSDLHIADGYYDLGGGKSLSLGERGIKLPRAMGHEILGVVEKGGPDAGAVPVGATRLVQTLSHALFTTDVARHVQNMYDQEDPELEPTNYFVPRDRRAGTL